MLQMSTIKEEMQSWDMDDERTKLIAEGISGWFDFSKEIEEAKIEMQPTRLFSKMQIFSVLGMAGIGKTTFARKIYNDIQHRFDHHVWITLGTKYQTGDILIDILAKINRNIDKKTYERR